MEGESSRPGAGSPLQEQLALRARQLALLVALARRSATAGDLKDLVSDLIGEVPEALGVDSVMVHLCKGDRLHLVGRTTLPGRTIVGAPELGEMPRDDSSVSGRCALQRRTVVVGHDDWPEHTRGTANKGGAKLAAATPLLYNDEVLGTVCTIRRDERPYTPEDIALLESCAAYTAAAIANAQRLDVERRRADDLNLINELGRLIAEQLDLPAVLHTGVRHLSRITSTPQTFLLLIDDKTSRLHMAATNLHEPGVMNITIALDEESIAVRAIAERKPVIVQDTSSRTGGFSRVRAMHFGALALLAVPLLSRGEPIGAVILGETRPGHTIDAALVERAVAVSNQLATAIVNARLYEDAQKNYRELVRAQERLVQRERLAALGELAASVAHEVRNPLGAIYNSMASLRKLAPASPQTDMLFDIATEEAERLNRIVGELLDFARPTEPRLSSQSLEAMIISAADAAFTATGDNIARFSMRMREAVPALTCDEQLVRQALINLLVNAVQAAPGGSSIAVQASTETRSERRLVRIDVIDRGPGIPESARSQVFQPFFTTRAKGTGLGLAIVKRIADAHHGHVEFESSSSGTTFTLRLPVEPPG